MGYLLPVRRERSRRLALPVFLVLPLPEEATPRAILSWGSALLHGISRIPRPGPLGRGHLSWGFDAPSALEEERVHGRHRLPGGGTRRTSLRWLVWLPAASRPPATAPLAGFPNLSAASTSPRRPAIFRQVALLGFHPSGVCSDHTAPLARRQRHALVTFLRPAARPSPGRGNRLACLPSPRKVGQSTFTSSSGPSSVWKSVCAAVPRLAVMRPTCPSWVSASSWSTPQQLGQACAGQPITLHDRSVRR
jgi:hypothetical protein